MRLVLQKMEYRRVYWKQDYVCNCFSSLILIGFLIGFSDWLILITGLSSQSASLFDWFCAFRLIFAKYHKCLFSVICRSFSRSSGLNKSISSNIFIAGSDISTVNFGTENERFKINSHPTSWSFFAKEVKISMFCHLWPSHCVVGWLLRSDQYLRSTIPCLTNLLSKSLPNGI